MSITQQVADLVEAAGRATVDDILPMCPGLTRAQALRALKHGEDSGRLRVVGHKTLARHIGATQVSIYQPAGKPSPTRVASVWELGSVL